MRGCCLCGEIEFEILGRLPKLYQCHCGLCRKQSGGASNAATVVDAHQMSSIKGAEVIRTWRKNTGFRSDFCVNCGSPVPNPLGDKPYYWIPAGLLDGPLESTVAAHFHVGSKAEWEPIPGQGAICAELPDLNEVLELLNRGPGA
jgi:hypothetical protein